MPQTLKTLAAIIALTAPALAAEGYRFPVYIDGEAHQQVVTPPQDQSAALGSQSIFYQISYPTDWQDRGLDAPMCNPCDHANDGVQWTDFHDHLMTRGDLEPRHVFNIGPAYTDDPKLDAQIAEVYASHLPVTSGVAANILLATRLDDGTPVARIDDLGFYFLAKLDR